MKVTTYDKYTDKVTQEYKLVMLSDTHNMKFESMMAQVTELNPDAILVVGDIVDRHRKTYVNALPFLAACAKTAPTFFSYGNHEVKFPQLKPEELAATGAVILNNGWTQFEELTIGGHTPRTLYNWVEDFEKQDGYKILLCHQPEQWKKHLKDKNIDLVLSGHAHGGQIRVGNRGLLAPDQGLFAKYVRGEYGNMIVGTGCTNTAAPVIPRLFNPPEIVVITLHPAKAVFVETAG